MFNIPKFDFEDGVPNEENPNVLDSDSDEDSDDEGPPGLVQRSSVGRESGKSHFVLVNARICRGWIGGSQKHRFCLAKASECAVATHQKKMAIGEDEERLFIKAMDGHRGEQAFAKPSLNAIDVPEECELKALVSSWQTVDELRLFIQENEAAEAKPVSGEDDDSHKSANDRMSPVAPVGDDKQAIIDHLCEGAATPVVGNKELGTGQGPSNSVSDAAAGAEGSTASVRREESSKVEEAVDALNKCKEPQDLSVAVPDGEASPWGEAKKLERLLSSQLESLTKLVVAQESAHKALTSRVSGGFQDFDVRVRNANRSVQTLTGRLGETNGLTKGQPLSQALPDFGMCECPLQNPPLACQLRWVEKG